MTSLNKGVVWIRRDLRLEDHTALSCALSQCNEVYVVFVFDKKILTRLKNKDDKRISFIIDSLREIEESLNEKGSSLTILYGDPTIEIPAFCKEIKANKLFFNRDYEPYAIKRDNRVIEELISHKIKAENFRDHVIFEGRDVLKSDLTPYKVFTPYSRAWKSKLETEKNRLKKFPLPKKGFAQFKNSKSILNYDWASEINFNYHQNDKNRGGRSEALKRIKLFKKKISSYNTNRDYPYLDGTSTLSPYIRFGVISIREIIDICYDQNNSGETSWLNEIIWREFYQMILFQFPKVEKHAFKLEYENIPWPKDKKLIEAWKQGKTGVPIVDAAMRDLNQNGTMPNRLRMVSASYFCKILLQDWRDGEAYFAEKLLDFDLAANNGGWQWSSSSGCDAAPYFRIFNPYLQSKKFDPEGTYIRKFCPELASYNNKEIHMPTTSLHCAIGQDYPAPIVNYTQRREECLKLYKESK